MADLRDAIDKAAYSGGNVDKIIEALRAHRSETLTALGGELRVTGHELRGQAEGGDRRVTAWVFPEFVEQGEPTQ